MIKKDLNPVKKKLGFAGWLEILVFAFSALHLTFLLLSLFNVLRPDFMVRETFSYIIAFILLAVCLLLYLFLMVIEKVNKLTIPNWLKCVLYIGFFVFTNIYYAVGLFEIFWTKLIFYAYLAFVLNIFALSLFFNVQKTDNGIMKTNNTFVPIFTFAATVAAATIIEIVVSSINLLINSTQIISTMFIANLCVVVFVSIIMSIIFYLSLSKSKHIINKCLIK